MGRFQWWRLLLTAGARLVSGQLWRVRLHPKSQVHRYLGARPRCRAQGRQGRQQVPTLGTSLGPHHEVDLDLDLDLVQARGGRHPSPNLPGGPGEFQRSGGRPPPPLWRAPWAAGCPGSVAPHASAPRRGGSGPSQAGTSGPQTRESAETPTGAEPRCRALACKSMLVIARVWPSAARLLECVCPVVELQLDDGEPNTAHAISALHAALAMSQRQRRIGSEMM